jgi:hypothetical protein
VSHYAEHSFGAALVGGSVILGQARDVACWPRLCENAKAINRDRTSSSLKSVFGAHIASAFNFKIELENIILVALRTFEFSHSLDPELTLGFLRILLGVLKKGSQGATLTPTEGGVHQYYEDILSRIAEEPVWFDEYAVPRYCGFAPTKLANIYSRETTLAEVTCQVCKRSFYIAFSKYNWPSGTIADAIHLDHCTTETRPTSVAVAICT